MNKSGEGGKAGKPMLHIILRPITSIHNTAFVSPQLHHLCFCPYPYAAWSGDPNAAFTTFNSCSHPAKSIASNLKLFSFLVLYAATF
ncbi:hypothetical protein [Methylotenera versatilis]|uniref:hypothetical protein n=1 Tax=Methylotenera versatilis TaxID=1055487 RepID=UPI00126A2C0D|nr:hypothetical protein [Methylotenera versatilis]